MPENHGLRRRLLHPSFAELFSPPPLTATIAALILVGAGFSRQAPAQEPPELITDRPDQTESAAIVPAGSFQLETGWIRSEDEEGAVEITTTGAPDTLLRIGLAERWELRLGWSGEVEVETREQGAGGARELLDGSGDADVGFKYRIRDERGRTPEMALLFGVSLPLGSGGLTSDRNDPTALLSLAHTLSERVALGYNLGVARESERSDSGTVETSTFFTYSAALGLTLSRRVGAFAELFGAFGDGRRAEDSHSADAGLTFSLRPNLQLDLAGGVGLNDAADDRFVLAGVTWRIPE